jgi:hypothetical protein
MCAFRSVRNAIAVFLLARIGISDDWNADVDVDGGVVGASIMSSGALAARGGSGAGAARRSSAPALAERGGARPPRVDSGRTLRRSRDRGAADENDAEVATDIDFWGREGGGFHRASN